MARNLGGELALHRVALWSLIALAANVRARAALKGKQPHCTTQFGEHLTSNRRPINTSLRLRAPTSIPHVRPRLLHALSLSPRHTNDRLKYAAALAHKPPLGYNLLGGRACLHGHAAQLRTASGPPPRPSTRRAIN